MLRQVSAGTVPDENSFILPKKINTTPIKPDLEYTGTIASRAKARRTRNSHESLSISSQFKKLEANSRGKKRNHTNRPCELPKPKKEITIEIKQEIMETDTDTETEKGITEITQQSGIFAKIGGYLY